MILFTWQPIRLNSKSPELMVGAGHAHCWTVKWAVGLLLCPLVVVFLFVCFYIRRWRYCIQMACNHGDQLDLPESEPNC